ncbi:hypothetical protein Tco_1100159, partial [Tanacetum coccineum]
PPPPPPLSGTSGASGITGASDFAQDPPPPPPSSTTNRDVLMHEESDFEAQDMGSDDEDSGSRHIPKVSLNQEWFKHLSEKERHVTPEPAWSIPSSSLPIPNNNRASALASSFECHKLLTNQVDEGLLRYNISRPLPLGGPPGYNRWYLIRCGLKKSICMTSQHHMVSLTGGSRDSNSTWSDTQLTPTKELLDKYGMQMIMRFNEIHKFSDGTLKQIDEALDYRVKEFKVNKVNPGLNTKFWATNDVIKSKQFMFAFQKRLKLRQIFRNLESFVGEQIQEGDYRLL